MSEQDGWVKTEEYIEKQFGTKPYRWDGYLNESGGLEFKSMLQNIAATGNITASELYTLAIGEGLYYNHIKTLGYDNNAQVFSFHSLGLDHFYSNLPKLIELGYLNSEFNEGDEFTKDELRINESNQIVKPVVFTNLTNAMQAFSAELNWRRDRLISDANILNYGLPTADQLMFWTYVYFQGMHNGKTLLTANKGWDYYQLKLDLSSQNPSSVASKAYRRLVTWEFLKIKQKWQE